MGRCRRRRRAALFGSACVVVVVRCSGALDRGQVEVARISYVIRMTDQPTARGASQQASQQASQGRVSQHGTSFTTTHAGLLASGDHTLQHGMVQSVSTPTGPVVLGDKQRPEVTADEPAADEAPANETGAEDAPAERSPNLRRSPSHRRGPNTSLIPPEQSTGTRRPSILHGLGRHGRSRGIFGTHLDQKSSPDRLR